MSRWMVARARRANSGRAFRREIVHSTSHGQRKRRVRSGTGSARLRGGEDEAPAYLLPPIVALRGAGADIDEIDVGAARDAVLGEADRLVRPGGDPFMPLPQFGEARVPAGPRALGAVEDMAVG